MPHSKRDNLIGSLLLTLCAIVWGSSFVAQSEGAQFVGPFTFISIRSLLGSAFLLPVTWCVDAYKKKKGAFTSMDAPQKRLFLKGGLLCGTALTAASVLQQFGIDRGTASGKAGFITALYILLVPIFSVVLRKRIRPIIWPCAVGAVCGLYLLCIKDGFHVQGSDLYVLACAAVYAVHILLIDRFSPYMDGVKLSCLQFFISGVFSGVGMLLFEEVKPELLWSAAGSIAYSGIMSSGVAFTLQILGQQRTEPTLASMLMSLESVFAMLTGMLVLHEIPTLREALGCVLMFAAILVAQLPEKKKAALPEEPAAAADGG
jgi:drug/metabolite transporter (DMT)-like permease